MLKLSGEPPLDTELREASLHAITSNRGEREKLVRPVNVATHGAAYVRIYPNELWHRANRNLRARQLLVKAGRTAPKCIGAGFVETSAKRYFVIAEEAMDIVDADSAEWSPDFAARVARDLDAMSRISPPFHLRPVFGERKWPDPLPVMKMRLARLASIHAFFRKLVESDWEAMRAATYAHPLTFGQPDMKPSNLCRHADGRPVWIDLDQFTSHPAELQLANIAYQCLLDAPEKFSTLVDAFYETNGQGHDLWTRQRLIYFRILTAGHALGRYRRNAKYGFPNDRPGGPVLFYCATHQVRDRGQSDSEMLAEIVEHIRRFRSDPPA